MLLSHPTILIVDDDEDIRANMSDILGELGYDVTTAGDGPAALASLGRRPFDVILLDLRMPGMDGLTLYREAKKVQPGAAAILVTAFASGLAREQARGLGLIEVLSKPVDLPRLKRQIDLALEQPLLLVVDDDRDLCASLWDVLHGQGYRVCLAHDEAGAARSLGNRSFRVVLIDLKLPDGDGAELVRRVRAQNPEARTVLITGHRPEADPRPDRPFHEDADAVHFKPFDIPTLLSTLKRLLEDGSRPSE